MKTVLVALMTVFLLACNETGGAGDAKTSADPNSAAPALVAPSSPDATHITTVSDAFVSGLWAEADDDICTKDATGNWSCIPENSPQFLGNYPCNGYVILNGLGVRLMQPYFQVDPVAQTITFPQLGTRAYSIEDDNLNIPSLNASWPMDLLDNGDIVISYGDCSVKYYLNN